MPGQPVPGPNGPSIGLGQERGQGCEGGIQVTFASPPPAVRGKPVFDQVVTLTGPDDCKRVTCSRSSLTPFTVVCDQLTVARAADDWNTVTSVAAVDDQLTVVCDQLAAANQSTVAEQRRVLKERTRAADSLWPRLNEESSVPENRAFLSSSVGCAGDQDERKRTARHYGSDEGEPPAGKNNRRFFAPTPKLKDVWGPVRSE